MKKTDGDRTFKDALIRGTGKCVAMLVTESGRRKYRPLVIWACGRNLGYDTQVEGTRALYLYDLICQYANPEPFLDVVEDRFFASFNKGNWLFQQECELLALFAVNGNERARRILEQGYVRLLQYLRRLNPARVSKPYIPALDNFYSLCEQLMVCVKPAEVRPMLERIVRDVGGLCMRDSFWNATADGVQLSLGFALGDRRLATILGKIKPSAESKAYKAALDQFESERRKSWPKVWGFRKVYRRISEQGTFGIRYMVRRWRLNGRTKDIEGLAKLYVVEKDCETRARLLDMFSGPDSQCEKYLPLDCVLRDAASDDDRLRVSALGVLEGIKNPHVHDFAVDMIKKRGVSYEAVKVLTVNYREADDDLLFAALKKLGEMSHDVYSALARIPESKCGDRLSVRMLNHLYETIACTCCRERVVRELGRRGLLTDDMLAECLHDASVDIRDYARRLLSRRRAKSATNPVNHVNPVKN